MATLGSPPRPNEPHIAVCGVCGKKRLIKDRPRPNRNRTCRQCGPSTRKPRAAFVVPDDGVQRYLNGEAANSLAKTYGVTPLTIAKALKRQGVAFRGLKEAAAFIDRSKMHEASATLRASGEMRRLISAAKQGIGRDEWTEFSTSHWQRVTNSKEWATWRMAVFTRDGFHCMLCGSPSVKGRKLQAHHIRPKAKYPELVFEVSNGITLCAPCHSTTFHKEAAFEPAFNAILAERCGP